MRDYTEEKRIRPHILTGALYMAVIIMMIYQVVAVRIYGDKGAFFASAPVFIYFLFYSLLVLSVQKAVYIMVRLRARRSQYHNAEANMHRSMRIFGVAGLLIGALYICLSYQYAGIILGTERGFIQIMIAGASVLLLGVQGVLRGYLQGIGYTRPIFISDLLIAIVSAIAGTIAVVIFDGYGLKVNGLLHVDEFSAVYGSVGMMVGILVGSLVGFLQIVISYNLRKSEIKQFVKTGAPKYLDNKNDVLAGIRPIMPLYGTPALMVLLDQCVYCIVTRKFHEDVDYMVNFGIFAGRITCTVTFIALIICVPFILPMNRVMARLERDELEGARDRYRRLIRSTNLLFIPVSIFVFAVGSTLQVALFGKSSEMAGTLMTIGGLMIAFVAHAVILSWLLNHMGRSLVLLFNLGISWAIHAAGLVLLFVIANLGIMGVMLSELISLVVYDFLCYFMLTKMIKMRREWIMNVVIPLVSSLIAGLLAFLLNKLFVNLIGDVLTLLICIIFFWAGYMMAMVVSGGFTAHELRKIPLGNLFYGVATAIRRDRYEEE